MIIALDPSSTCIGYAIFEPEGRLVEHGRFTPKRTKDGPYARIPHMVSELNEMLLDQSRGRHEDIATVIVEIPPNRMAAGRQGGGAGMATYGVAVGFVLGMLSKTTKDVRIIDAHDWTRGIPKVKRQAWVSATHSSYRAATDPGGDVADAIGLGEWWITEQKLNSKTALAGEV